MLIGVLVLALASVGIVVVRRDPVGIVKDGWYALNRRYVDRHPGPGRGRAGRGHRRQIRPGRLVDGSVEECTMNWAPSAESTCGPAAGTGVIVLTFAPTRIRQIQIVPGLDKSNPQRPLQPLPKTVGHQLRRTGRASPSP